MDIVNHECHSYCEICGKDLMVDLAAAQERERVLREALEFYQHVENYKATAPVARGDGSYDYDIPVLIDNGEIARKALC